MSNKWGVPFDFYRATDGRTDATKHIFSLALRAITLTVTFIDLLQKPENSVHIPITPKIL